MRELGKVFRERKPLVGSRQSGMISTPIVPCLVVPRNADFRMIGTASANATHAVASINGALASVVQAAA